MDRSTWISANVFQVGGDNLTAPGDCSFYAVRTDDDGLVLIDCGVGGGHRALASNLSRMSHSIADVSSLILTHCHIDHVGGAHIIVAESGCEVVAHEADSDAIEGRRPELTAADWYGVEYVPVKIDRILAGPVDKLVCGGTELVAVHTPGHTPGSISVYLDDDDGRVLFGQDIHGPFERSWGSDIGNWRRSMEKLLSLKADVLCEGHFGVMTGKKAVGEFIEGYLGRY